MTLIYTTTMQSPALNSARTRSAQPDPAATKSWRGRITERFPRLPGQLQRIARFALDAPEDFALGTAAQLAEQIGVQPSALVRFAAAVDCDGFAELRQLFRTQLRARTLTYRERIERLQSRAPKATSPGAVFRAQAGQAIAELQRFQHAIDDRLLTQAVELIATASQINLLAARRSFPVAAYLAYALNQLEVRTQLLDNVGGMNREFAARIGADEVVIAISFRNYTGEVVDIADSCRQARRRGYRNHRQQAVAADQRGDAFIRDRRRWRRRVPLAGRADRAGAIAGRRGRSSIDGRAREPETGFYQRTAPPSVERRAASSSNACHRGGQREATGART